MIQKWLAFILNCVVALLAIIIVTMATQLSSTTGLTGAALVSLMTFGDTLTYGIRMYTELETSLGAVSRIMSLSKNVKPETRPGEDLVPDAAWPQRGEIRIQGVSASYTYVPRI